MKKLYIIIVLSLIGRSVYAQKELLTLDEHNKYIYYQVAEKPSLSADTLYNRCLAGLKQYYRNQSVKPVTTAGASITFKAKMMVYSSETYVKHEDAEVPYTLQVEFKDGKYRFWLTDFVFKPYQRNRYGIYAKVPGAAIPIEEAKGKYDAKMLDSDFEQIVKAAQQIGENLKIYAAEPVKKPAEVKKVDTRKW